MDLDGQIVSLCIPRHISYAKHLAELISVCGACLERQNKNPKNFKGVVAIPLMFVSFRYASHSLKQSVYVFDLALIYRREQCRKIDLLKIETKNLQTSRAWRPKPLKF